MKALFTSDTHFTARPEDEYRWQLFPWLINQVKNRGIDAVFIVGDLTNEKDGHSAVLVNLIMDNLSLLSELCPVHVLMGNHDYVDEGTPFFRFLGRPLQAPTKLAFHSKPAEIGVKGQKLLLLPHSRTFRRVVNNFQLEKYDAVLIHQPVQGAKAENGDSVSGTHPKSVEGAKRVIAGDIHVPQTIRNITYCGAPYPIRFGDEFKPRCLLLENGELRSIPRTTIRKATLNVSSAEEVKESGLTAGDQCRINVHLRRRDLGDWDSIRNRIADLIDEMGVRLASLKLVEKTGRNRRAESVDSATADPKGIWKEYGRKHNVDPEVLAAGIRLLEE